MKTFPRPLTTEEEKDYLERYRNGDLKAKDVLIERNLRLVAHVVRKYQTAEDEMDDLISIGTIGLIKAVSTFDGNRNSKLGTYAAKCIENAMLTSGHLRRKIFGGALFIMDSSRKIRYTEHKNRQERRKCREKDRDDSRRGPCALP